MKRNYLILCLVSCLFSACFFKIQTLGKYMAYPAGERGWMYFYKPQVIRADSGKGKIITDFTFIGDVFFKEFNDTFSLSVTYKYKVDEVRQQDLVRLKMNNSNCELIKTDRMPTSEQRWRYTWIKLDTNTLFPNNQCAVSFADSAARYDFILKYK